MPSQSGKLLREILSWLRLGINFLGKKIIFFCCWERNTPSVMPATASLTVMFICWQLYHVVWWYELISYDSVEYVNTKCITEFHRIIRDLTKLDSWFSFSWLKHHQSTLTKSAESSKFSKIVHNKSFKISIHLLWWWWWW